MADYNLEQIKIELQQDYVKILVSELDLSGYKVWALSEGIKVQSPRSLIKSPHSFDTLLENE